MLFSFPLDCQHTSMSKFQTIRAVIIDLDGTMIDTAPDFLITINRMRADVGLAELDLTTIKNFVGKGSENLIRRILSLDWDENKVDREFAAAFARYHHHYNQINGQFSSLYPNVVEGLQALRAQGLRLACVTNKPISLALPLLEQKNLKDFFEIIYGGECLPRKKPDPLPLLQVCRDFKLEPAQVLAIGDSSNDAQAAHAAGCPVLLVPYGYNHGEAVQSLETDGIVETLLDAANLLIDSKSELI